MKQQHFLLVTFPPQGHINPTLALAYRLTSIPGVHVTFSTAVSGHRRMFPSSAATVTGEPISYIPFSDGYDDGYDRAAAEPAKISSNMAAVGSKTLAAIIDDLAASGRPVTGVIYTIFLQWVADVARSRGLPATFFWIQPAAVFAIYYHYFRGGHEGGLIAANRGDPSFELSLPFLPPLRIRDLPSFVLGDGPDDPYSVILDSLRCTFRALESDCGTEKPKVLVNTFEELERIALRAEQKYSSNAMRSESDACLGQKISNDGWPELIPIGPLVARRSSPGEGKESYMEWLDSKAERSVVYVSFGTLAVVKKRQVEEIRRCLDESGRPFLWAMRKGGGAEVAELERERGLVVEWCEQREVLSHRAVGCFVTHCGWNSTTEAMEGGVPIVGVPQSSDQGTNAWLVEAVAGTGLRAEADADGVADEREIRRCLEVVMGEEEVKRRAGMWRDKARAAVEGGGPSDRNLKAFVEDAARV